LKLWLRKHDAAGVEARCFSDGSAPIAPVEYLEAAPAFASNHGLGIAVTQLDLTDRPTCRSGDR